ncbi:hypothetical protein TNCV_1028601 [Trichonephila clavipes]|nr:hypothetical protein TNCV_1028601 [Trichonephila clavipes]
MPYSVKSFLNIKEDRGRAFVIVVSFFNKFNDSEKLVGSGMFSGEWSPAKTVFSYWLLRSEDNGSKTVDLGEVKKLQVNRRKCIRAITQNDSARFPVSRDETHKFFTKTWESTQLPVERPMPDPPSRLYQWKCSHEHSSRPASRQLRILLRDRTESQTGIGGRSTPTVPS